MALWKYKITPTERGNMGQTYQVGPAVEQEFCAVCGAEAYPQYCQLCRKRHHHGRVHFRNDTGGYELVALCPVHELEQ